MSDRREVNRQSAIGNRQSDRCAFSLVEIMLAVSILSLIVLALMTVFNSTQQAFRASVTQTDVLESSRAAVEMITTDLRGMSVALVGKPNFNPPLVFGTLDNNQGNPLYPNLKYQPLIQDLVGSSGSRRTNLLQWIFIVGRENTKWTAVGYVVVTNTPPLYSLYRFYTETNTSAWLGDLQSQFSDGVNNMRWTNSSHWSHVMDGVVHFVVRAYDTNGVWMTNGYAVNQPMMTNRNVTFFVPTPASGEVGCWFRSNSLPAAVELQMGVLEDRTLQRAESLPDVAPVYARSNYLSKAAGAVHLFRQRVDIPNFDPAAYQ